MTAPSTPEGKAGAHSLQRSLQPLAAAVVQAALDHPEWLDDHLEALEAQGFGDPQLSGLASEIIRLRLDSEDRGHALDTQGLVRHLADLGYGLLLGEVSKAARKSGAPFLASDSAADERETQEQWSQAFEVLTRVAALEDALSTAKAEAGRGLDAASFSRLKAERDALKRAIRTGTVWAGGSS